MVQPMHLPGQPERHLEVAVPTEKGVIAPPNPKKMSLGDLCLDPRGRAKKHVGRLRFRYPPYHADQLRLLMEPKMCSQIHDRSITRKPLKIDAIVDHIESIRGNPDSLRDMASHCG